MTLKSWTTRQNWPKILNAARVTTRNHLRAWQRDVALRGGVVNSASLLLPMGCLVYNQNLEQELLAALPPATAYRTTARGWAKAVGDTWQRWVSGYRALIPTAYPAFIAYPAPQAPPMPNIPFPLSVGISNETDFTPERIHQLIKSGIGPTNYNEAGAAGAVQEYADWLCGSFQAWRLTLVMQRVMGWGPVPGYAPPTVVVSSVVNGQASAEPGFLVGPLFPD